MKKIKLLLFVSSLLITGYSLAIAAEPTWSTAARDGKYAITHDSFSVTSSVNSVPATIGYRKIKFVFQASPAMLDKGTSIFFRTDGSSQSIVEKGYMIRFSTLNYTAGTVYTGGHYDTKEIEFESNLKIWVKLSTGVTGEIEGRYIQKEK